MLIDLDSDYDDDDDDDDDDVLQDWHNGSPSWGIRDRRPPV